jgi:hypothetical protein
VREELPWLRGPSHPRWRIKRNLTTVKRQLAEFFPDVVFTFGIGGRSHNRGHAISWTGGPSQADVMAKVDLPFQSSWKPSAASIFHFQRQMTEAESTAYYAEQDARREAERPAREAAEAAKKVANRASGIAQAASTRARKLELTKAAAQKFPGVAFKFQAGRYGSVGVEWTGGPAVTDVANGLGISAYQCCRYDTQDEVARRLALQRSLGVEREIRDYEADCRANAGMEMCWVLSEDARDFVAVRRQRRRAKEAKLKAAKVAEALARPARNAQSNPIKIAEARLRVRQMEFSI